MFDHFLITRFNVNVWWSNSSQSEEWLHHRFAIFDKYCFPSVVFQSCKNFKWLVLFDKNTDKSRLEKYSECEQFVPLFLDYFDVDIQDINHTKHDGPVFQGVGKRELHEVIVSDKPFVATTRLDNDDAIHKDFISIIQSNIEPRTEILNMPNGYTLHNDLCYSRSLYHNPFITMVERSDQQLKTVYGVPHWKADKFMNLRQIGQEEKAWIQIIHDKNFVNHNHFTPTDEARTTCNFSEFGIYRNIF